MQRNEKKLLHVLGTTCIVASLVLIGCTSSVEVTRAEDKTKGDPKLSQMSVIELEKELDKIWTEYQEVKHQTGDYNKQLLLTMMVIQNQIEAILE